MFFGKCGEALSLPSALFLVLLGVLLLGVPEVRARDECGSQPFEGRYSQHGEALSLGATFGAGDIVYTQEGGEIKLWMWTDSVSTQNEPSTADNAGWRDVTEGYAFYKVDCDVADIIGSTTQIEYQETDLALIFRRSGTTVDSIVLNADVNGEIHIVDGSVSHAAGLGDNPAVSLSTAGEYVLRLTTKAGTSVANANTVSGSHAISVSGMGDIFVDLAGNTFATARGDSGSGNAALYAHSTAGNIDIDVRGGVHQVNGGGAEGSVVYATVRDPNTADHSAGQLAIDIQISGASTLVSPGSDAAVVEAYGRSGRTEIHVLDNALICAGRYSPSTGNCSVSLTARAIGSGRQLAGTGTFILENTGRVVGRIQTADSASSQVMNHLGGTLFGSFRSSGDGQDTLTNAGLFVMIASSDFGGGTDSFTNRGTLVLYHTGATIALNNLENIRLERPSAGRAGSLFRVSLPSATFPNVTLLDIQDANPILEGTVDVVTRNGDPIPTSGSIAIITGSQISSNTDLSRLVLPNTFATGAGFRVVGNRILLSFGEVCGAVGSRTRQAPGLATQQITCDAGDDETLTATTDIIQSEEGVAVVYDRGAAVKRILNRGDRGEVHILSGSVKTPDDKRASTGFNTVQLGAELSTPERTRLVAALEATQSEGDLTPAEVFARDRAVRLSTAAGTFVRNEDPVGSADLGAAIRVNGWGTHIHMDIAGDTYSEHTGIRVANAAAGDTNVRILGGTHRSKKAATLYVSTNPNFNALSATGGTRPSGTIDVDVAGETRMSSENSANLEDADSAVIYLLADSALRATTDRSPPNELLHTVDVGPDVVICRGTFTQGLCRPAGGIAIAFGARGTEAQSNNRILPLFQLTNEGQIYGDVTSLWNARGVRITNRGVIVGNYTSRSAGTYGAGDADGPDILVNEAEGLWIMTGVSDFREGRDSFTNRGTLVLRHSGSPIAMENLETFNQTTGATLLVEIDPRRFSSDLPTCTEAQLPSRDTCETEEDALPQVGDPGLPSGHIFNVGSASGTLAGRLQVVLLDTAGMHGSLTHAELRALIAALDDTQRGIFAVGHSLDLSALSAREGVARDTSAGFSYDLSTLPVRAATSIPQLVTEERIAYAYDSVLQSSWFSTRAVLHATVAAECAAEDAYYEGSEQRIVGGGCSWVNVGGRFFSHERDHTGFKKTEERVGGFSAGLQAPLGSFMDYELAVSTTVGYEYSDIDMGEASGVGHRILGGVSINALGSAEFPLSLFMGVAINGGTYEVSRPGSKGDPELLLVGGHGGLEYAIGMPLSIVVTPRLQLDVVWVRMGGFTETNNEVTVGALDEVMVSGAASMELRRASGTSFGVVESWLELGVMAFATDPELEYKVSGGSASGTMDRYLVEGAVGLKLVNGRASFDLFWDGLLGFDTLSNAITFRAKYAF